MAGMDGEPPRSSQAGANQLSGSAQPNQLSGSEGGGTSPDTSWAPMPAGFSDAAATATAPAPPAVPARRGFNWKGIALRVGLVGAIGVGGLVLRDRLTGAATDLKVGDCFDEPAGVTEVSEVQHQPCTDAHDAEVIYVANYTGDSYPVISGFDDYVVDNCIPAFQTYVGRSFDEATELDLSYFFPTLDGWGKGDREITCYLVNVDSSKLTRSMKAGGG